LAVTVIVVCLTFHEYAFALASIHIAYMCLILGNSLYTALLFHVHKL